LTATTKRHVLHRYSLLYTVNTMGCYSKPLMCLDVNDANNESDDHDTDEDSDDNHNNDNRCFCTL